MAVVQTISVISTDPGRRKGGAREGIKLLTLVSDYYHYYYGQDGCAARENAL